MDDVIPIDSAQWAPGLPSPERDQQDALSPRELEARAKRTLEFHKRGLDSRRLRDLTTEKYLLHIDGEGDAQWYDIYQGQRLQMAPRLNGVAPTSDNQEAAIVDNFVAHLTTQPYRFVVEPKHDRESRQSAIIDQAIVNAQVRKQRWNSLFAESKGIAAATGFCPIHSMWRDEWHGSGDFEALIVNAQPGDIDSFVGDPLNTVFNAGAKHGSYHRMTWGRTLPAELVRAAFPEANIEGDTRMPSASLFQRTVQKWIRTGRSGHGHAELTAGRGSEELIALIYDEIMPGYDPDYPEGSLCILALQGQSAVKPEDSRGGPGRAVHLWSGPLPARRSSAVIVYSHHRFDDIHGKPYIADVDDDQMELNQRLALLKDYSRRASRPQLGGSGGIDVDTVGFEGDTYFEVHPEIGAGTPMLQWLEFPNKHVQTLENEIQMIYERMYRKAGWQAASRGESVSGSGKKIIALQQADDSIMGPISQRTREEAEEMADLNWALTKEFMDAPTVIDVVGDELAHMIEPYIDRTMMSPTAPGFTLVSGFGTSTEAKVQQLMNMLSMTDPLGEPIMTAKEFRKSFPDNSVYTETDDPREVRERRPRVVNEMIRQAAEKQAAVLQQQVPQWKPGMGDPFTDQLGRLVEMEVAQAEDVLMDDDIQLNVEWLSVITQDTTEHPVARRAAIYRQQRYFMWLAGKQMATAAAAAPAPPEGEETDASTGARGGGQGGGGGSRGGSRGGSQPDGFNPAREGGTPTAESMVQADKNFSREVA